MVHKVKWEVEDYNNRTNIQEDEGEDNDLEGVVEGNNWSAGTEVVVWLVVVQHEVVDDGSSGKKKD